LEELRRKLMHKNIIDTLKEELKDEDLDKEQEDKAIEQVLLDSNPESFIGSQGVDNVGK
jgi:hypothetical protein